MGSKMHLQYSSLIKIARQITHHSTARLRKLPDFLIIGAEKGGTDTLFAQLLQHPQISSPLRTSLHYFEGNYNKGELWYRAHFPLALSSDKTITGEKSTFYIYDPRAPKRIHALIPQVKLIVLLREPVQRAISQYFHYKNKGHESMPIADAFEKEEERISHYLQNISASSLYPAGHPLKVFSYKSRGYYAEQITNYFQYFSQNQIHIEKSEDYFANPLKSLKNIYNFLNIDSDFEPKNLAPLNVGRKKNVSKEFVDGLRDHFKPHNERLSELLNKRIMWDLL